MRSKLCLAALFVGALWIPMGAQTSSNAAAPAGAQATKPEIKHVPASYTNPSSGKEMFKAYCASCHGQDGRGDGPAASALKTPPTDLTQLAATNGGKFPDAKIAEVIKGDKASAAHGDKDMPVWGPVFLSMGQHDSTQMQLRIRNLTKYVASLQQK